MIRLILVVILTVIAIASLIFTLIVMLIQTNFLYGFISLMVAVISILIWRYLINTDEDAYKIVF